MMRREIGDERVGGETDRKHSVNNDRGFTMEQCTSEQLKNSFFIKTVIELNHLETAAMHAEAEEGFAFYTVF